MDASIAERELLYALKGESTQQKLVVRISAPYRLDKGKANFEFPSTARACKIVFDGLPEPLTEEVHGMDGMQALAMAADIDPYLRGLSKKYEFYWATGEPYFEDD